MNMEDRDQPRQQPVERVEIMPDPVEFDDTAILVLVKRVADLLSARGAMLTTAESCTGGWIAKACTDVAGSSEWFDSGYAAYSYRAKEDLLGVSRRDLEHYGAVSDEIAAQMAEGARRRTGADIAISATGIAGPGGGMPGKPVGLVHFGWSVAGQEVRFGSRVFEGDREAVRRQTVMHALSGIFDAYGV
jgi:nicotinamide-nucleotide amidase